MKRASAFDQPTFDDHRDAHTLIDWSMPQMADVLRRAGSNDDGHFCIVCADAESPIIHSAIRSACMPTPNGVSPTEKTWLLLLPMATVRQILNDTSRNHGACAVACSLFLDKAIPDGSIRVVVFTSKAAVPMAVKTAMSYVAPASAIMSAVNNNSNRLLN